MRLHVEQPLLGAGQLRHPTARALAFDAARETFRRILIRRRDLVVALDQERRRRPRRIRVSGPRQLWGTDLTVVSVLGFIPAWILAVVDYHGSRLLAFERLPWPTSVAVATVLGRAMRDHGPPERLLTDRAPVFRAAAVEDLLAQQGVRDILIRPAHPWTGGRIERIFRTFKETVFGLVWLVASYRQLDRFAAHFRVWYSRDRQHIRSSTPTPCSFAICKSSTAENCLGPRNLSPITCSRTEPCKATRCTRSFERWWSPSTEKSPKARPAASRTKKSRETDSGTPPYSATRGTTCAEASSTSLNVRCQTSPASSRRLSPSSRRAWPS